MKKRYILFLILGLVLITLICIMLMKKPKEVLKEKDEFTYTPLIFKICDEDSCVHLLGSIHVGDERVTKFKNIVNDIYKQSDYLAVEVDTDNIAIDESIFLLKYETLDDLISNDLKTKLEDFSTKHFLFPYDSLKIFSLGYIQNYLSLLPALESNLVSGGVDNYFLKLAHEDGKKIISLETYESQLAFLTDYSNEFYTKQIEYILDNYNLEKDLIKKLYEAYLTGDKKKIESVLNEEDESLETAEEQEYSKAMITDRNILMANNIEAFLKENKNVLVVVGEAHVLLDGGIIDLIKDKNYDISTLK